MRVGINESIHRARSVKHDIAARLALKTLTIEEVAQLATSLAQSLIDTLESINRIDNAPDIHGYDMTRRPYRGVNKNSIEIEIQRVARSIHIPKLPTAVQTSSTAAEPVPSKGLVNLIGALARHFGQDILLSATTSPVGDRAIATVRLVLPADKLDDASHIVASLCADIEEQFGEVYSVLTLPANELVADA
jgi:hypothetical protein